MLNCVCLRVNVYVCVSLLLRWKKGREMFFSIPRVLWLDAFLRGRGVHSQVTYEVALLGKLPPT